MRDIQMREYVELEGLILEAAIKDLEDRGIDTNRKDEDYLYELKEAIDMREKDIVYYFTQGQLDTHLECEYGLTYNWDAVKSIDPEDHGLEYYVNQKVVDLVMTEFRKYAHQGMFKRI